MIESHPNETDSLVHAAKTSYTVPKNEDDPEKSTAPEDNQGNNSFIESFMDTMAGTVDNVVEGAQNVVGHVQEAAEHMVEGAQNIVENVQEAAGQVVDNVQEAAVDFKEDLVEEAQEVVDVFVENVQEANDGDLFFLDMGLTRNLSILPDDVTYAAQHTEGGLTAIALPMEQTEALTAGDEEKKEQQIVVVDPAVIDLPKDENSVVQEIPVVAYFLLATAVISLSSIGPLLDVQQDATASMKLYWRMAGTAVLLTPFALKDVIRNGHPKLNKAQWLTFLLSTFFYDVMCLGFVLALDYTAVGNAVILANSQALLLLIGKLCIGKPVSFMEGSGAIVASLGAVLCSKDSSEASEVSALSGIFGDFLALAAGAGGVGYIITAKATRQHMSLFSFMFLTMAIGAFMILLFQICIGETITFGMDRRTGIWSFFNMQQDRLPLELTMVVVCNMLGTMGYVRAMQYFNDLIISTAGLMEPVIAEFLAFSFGVSALPGWQGWLGNALVAGGTFLVVFPSSQAGKGGSLVSNSEKKESV